MMFWRRKRLRLVTWRHGTVDLEVKPADVWYGLFTRVSTVSGQFRLREHLWREASWPVWEFWVCVIPMLPIHIRMVRRHRPLVGRNIYTRSADAENWDGTIPTDEQMMRYHEAHMNDGDKYDREG